MLEFTSLVTELSWPCSTGAAGPAGRAAAALGLLAPGREVSRTPGAGCERAGRPGFLPQRNATGCAGVQETWRVGTRTRAQGCVLGISLEPGRSRQGSEHDLENPYRDEKVQSASTFLRRPRCAQCAAWLGWQRALRLHGAPTNSSLSGLQEIGSRGRRRGVCRSPGRAGEA